MIVVDASAVIETLLQTGASRAVEARLFAPGQSLHAPHLIDLEVTQVVRRYLARGDMDEARAQASLDAFAGFTIRRYPHEALLARIWGLRANLTAYDGAYIALAEALDCELVTTDRRLAAAPGHTARVVAVR